MLEIVSWFVIYFVTHVLDCYIFSKLIGEKFMISKKNFLIILLFTIVDYTLGSNYYEFIKIIVTNLITFLLLKIIYDKSISKTLMGTLFIYIGYGFAEALFAIVFFFLLKVNDNYVYNNLLGIIISNFLIFIIYIFIFNIKYLVKKISDIVKWCDEKKFWLIASKIILAMYICCILVYNISYYKINLNFISFVFAVFICSIIFIVGYFNEKSGNNKLNIEYAQLLEYVKTYEDEVVDKSKKQHEYKNQLIIIDNLIPKTNKKAKEYLKKVLNNVEDVTDNDWLVKLKNLPSGGIKGLIHFKIKKMIDKKISVFVYVDKKLSKKDIWENIEKNLEDISRILGVYLDNAIEASEKSMDKQIIIEFVNNRENIEFILSNSYDGNINFDELDKEGYSTKGKGRGVGLSLVKDIINNNSILTQLREINGKFFVQKLYIKK